MSRLEKNTKQLAVKKQSAADARRFSRRAAPLQGMGQSTIRCSRQDAAQNPTHDQKGKKEINNEFFQNDMRRITVL